MIPVLRLLGIKSCLFSILDKFVTEWYISGREGDDDADRYAPGTAAESNGLTTVHTHGARCVGRGHVRRGPRPRGK